MNWDLQEQSPAQQWQRAPVIHPLLKHGLFVFHRYTRSSRTTGSSRSWFTEYSQFQGRELSSHQSSTNPSVTREGAHNSPGALQEGHGPGWKDNAHGGSLRNSFKNQLCPWINPYKLHPGPCCSPPRSCTLCWVLNCSVYKQTAQWPISGFQVYAKRCNLLLFFRLMYYYFMYL